MPDGSTFHKPLTVGRYDPTHPEVIAGIARWGGDRAAYEEDHVVSCSQCSGHRAWVGRRPLEDWLYRAGFDTGIHEQDGVLVCDDCAPLYREEASYDPFREHNTWSAA